ncbi:ROK family transcriptional regulator [Agromyces sp. SYSU T00194]|uniref:ROK family transcriptional regulator n=1 Tax=Agromyces chitinivorans TaxID=3158560 RepID=UPI00339548AE
MASAASDDWSFPRLHDGQRAVLLDVLIHGERSRAELARRNNLSRASLARLTRELVDLGFVEEVAPATPPNGRGRPSEMLRIRPDSAHFVGVKLTGEALYAAVTNLHAEVLVTEEHPLASREVADVVALIADVVARARTASPRLSAVGVCLAGDVHLERGSAVVVGSHFLGWDQVPLEALVQRATGLPATISNDVQALTLAHHWFGAGVGLGTLAVIGLGAGIGAGLVVNDELVRGSRGHPGKVGHLRVSETGPSCDRGHVGCASAYVTIPALLRNSGVDGFWETIDAARAGEPRASAAVAGAARALGIVIAQIANLIDPQKVIVSGEGREVANVDRGLLDRVVAEYLDPAMEPFELDVHDFRFADYAWGAAISAIRRVA